MGWADLTIFAGIFVSVAGIVLLARQIGRRLRDRLRGINRLDEIADMASQTVPFGGVLLVQLGNIAQHISAGLCPQILGFPAFGFAAMLLVLGVQLGRLLMRWQLRRLRVRLDTESGLITLRS